MNPNLENLLRRGWKLTIDADLHWKGKLHAVIHSPDGEKGRHYLGVSLDEAICGLNEFINIASGVEAA